MNKLVIILTLASSLICGCNFIGSSIEYTRGTQYLDSGDYDKAVEHLEKCVRMDPDMAYYQNNLAVAYLKTNNLEKAWIHSRWAVSIDPNHYESKVTFENLSQALYRSFNLNIGVAENEILSCLGHPDAFIVAETTKIFVYGIDFFKIRNGKLESIEKYKKSLGKRALE